MPAPPSRAKVPGSGVGVTLISLSLLMINSPPGASVLSHWYAQLMSPGPIGQDSDGRRIVERDGTATVQQIQKARIHPCHSLGNGTSTDSAVSDSVIAMLPTVAV